VREGRACKFRDIRRTCDVLFANLRAVTRHTRFANRQPPFARAWPNDWFQPRPDPQDLEGSYAAVAAVRGRGVMSRFLPSSSRSGARALQRSGRSFGTCQPCETHPHKQAKGHGGNRAKFIRATCCDVYAKGDKNQPCGCCDSQRKWCRPRVSAPQPYRGNYVRKARQEIEPKHEIHIGSQCSLLLRPTKQSFCPRDNGQ